MANTTVAANMGLVGTISGTDYGTATGQSTRWRLTPAGAAHPTGGGLTAGTVTTSTVGESIGWAKPAAGAVTTATLAADSSKATVFSYEPGTAMITGTAPAQTGRVLRVERHREHDRQHRTALRRCSRLGSEHHTDRQLRP
ncbi:MAG: hypothetical protein V9F03_10395 [Microthrixaceae bacterium]